MARRKNESASAILGFIGLFIAYFLLAISPAILTGWVLYKLNDKIPDDLPKDKLNLYAWLTALPIFIGGAWVFARSFGEKAVNLQDQLRTVNPLYLSLLAAIPMLWLYVKEYKVMQALVKLRGEYRSVVTKFIEYLTREIGAGKTVSELPEEVTTLKKKMPVEFLNHFHTVLHGYMLNRYTFSGLNINSTEEKALSTFEQLFTLPEFASKKRAIFKEFITDTNLTLSGQSQGLHIDGFMPLKKEKILFYTESNISELVKDTTFVGTSISLRNIVPLGDLLNPKVFIGKGINNEKLKIMDAGKLILTSHRVAFVGQKISRTFGINEIMGLQEDEDNHLMISRTNKVRNEVFTLDPIKRELFIGLVQFLGSSASIDKIDVQDNNPNKEKTLLDLQDKAAKLSAVMNEYKQEFVAITLLVAGNILCMNEEVKDEDWSRLLSIAKKHTLFVDVSDEELKEILEEAIQMDNDLEEAGKDPDFSEMQFVQNHNEDIIKIALEIACMDKVLTESEEDQIYYWAGILKISDDWVEKLIQTKNIKRTAS